MFELTVTSIAFPTPQERAEGRPCGAQGRPDQGAARWSQARHTHGCHCRLPDAQSRGRRLV